VPDVGADGSRGRVLRCGEDHPAGVSEESFQKADGSKASAWETYTGRVLTLEADENGNLPDVTRIAGESPDGFISSLNHERSIMAGHTGLAPAVSGDLLRRQPASADAIRMSDFRLKTIADRLAISVGNDWEKLMVMALKIWASTRSRLIRWKPIGARRVFRRRLRTR
jgi:hypothetical protein